MSIGKTLAIGSTLIGISFGAVVALPQRASAQLDLDVPRNLPLVNGIVLQGRLGNIDEMGPTVQNPDPWGTGGGGIIMVDDDLRRVFVSRYMVAQVPSPLHRLEEQFQVYQKVHRSGGTNSEIGPILGIGPWDFGRRQITIGTSQGPKTYMQGITEINPRYCRVEGIAEPGVPGRRWDMRIATSSVPTDVIVAVLHSQIKDPSSPNERLGLVEFFAQAENYKQAEKELLSVANDFPGLKEQLTTRREALRQQIARQALREATLRLASWQPVLCEQILQTLETQLGLASEILVEIRDAKSQLAAELAQVERARTLLNDLLDRILAAEELDAVNKTVVEDFKAEVQQRLSLSTHQRLATFARLADDPEQTDQQKLALAISGWTIGSGSATQNLAIALSVREAERLVGDYLKTPRIERRIEILDQLKQIEGGSPEYVAKIVALLPPPMAPSLADMPVDRPMEFQIEIPGTQGEQARYLVQLPPEYDVYRRYPCIVTLPGETANTTPEAQVRWWTGDFNPNLGVRMGQAARYGFIVISPDWRTPGQSGYQYSDREHAIVLKSLRDALRRFAIDTDRVFLSGHFSGADAAWDIGQAHPEHWAGVIPISAQAGKYIDHYWRNTRSYVPFYFVNGSRDFNSLDRNKTVWNRHMGRPTFETMVVHYRGRGAEKFSDEIGHLFSWMQPQRRNLDEVQEFECATMREWDNYFWWFEVDLRGHPKMIAPQLFDRAKRDPNFSISDWTVSGEIRNGQFWLRGAPEDATLWLLPGLVDFNKDVEIRGNCGSFKGPVKPSTAVILEDVRTRADRQHPFWGRIDRQQKRWTAFEEPETDNE